MVHPAAFFFVIVQAGAFLFAGCEPEAGMVSDESRESEGRAHEPTTLGSARKAKRKAPAETTVRMLFPNTPESLLPSTPKDCASQIIHLADYLADRAP